LTLSHARLTRHSRRLLQTGSVAATVQALAENTVRVHQATARFRATGRALRIRSQQLRVENRWLRLTRRRALIRRRLLNGRLPYDSAPKLLGGPGDGGACGARDGPLLATQLVMAVPMAGSFVELHGDCVMLWDQEGVGRHPHIA